MVADFDEATVKALEEIGGMGLQNAADGFSRLLGRTILVENPCVRLIPLLEIAKEIGGPEDEAIGIYLRAEGDVSAQIMLIIPYAKALELVDMVMGMPPGSTDHLGSMERSALGEVGNMSGAFFLNAISDRIGISARPTPPAVMVDMVGAIIDIIIATTGGVSEQVLLMEANFQDGDRQVEMDFWVIPDALSIHALRASRNDL
jgi:chemotaxis protein CheC